MNLDARCKMLQEQSVHAEHLDSCVEKTVAGPSWRMQALNRPFCNEGVPFMFLPRSTTAS